MPAHRVLPNAIQLLVMVANGMTQQEIADETYRNTGVRVTRAAVSAALVRDSLAVLGMASEATLLAKPDEATEEDVIAYLVKRTGSRPTDVRIALAEAAMPPRRARYSELLPWRVRAEDDNHYALRMLRAEARKRAGTQISDRELRRLEAWKKTLKENHAVVHYDPDVKHSPRFFYVPARPVDKDLIRLPDDQVSVA